MGERVVWIYPRAEQQAPRLRQRQRCPIVLDKVDARSQHVTLKLLFDDGVIWIVRIRFP